MTSRTKVNVNLSAFISEIVVPAINPRLHELRHPRTLVTIIIFPMLAALAALTLFLQAQCTETCAMTPLSNTTGLRCTSANLTFDTWPDPAIGRGKDASFQSTYEGGFVDSLNGTFGSHAAEIGFDCDILSTRQYDVCQAIAETEADGDPPFDCTMFDAEICGYLFPQYGYTSLGRPPCPGVDNQSPQWQYCSARVLCGIGASRYPCIGCSCLGIDDFSALDGSGFTASTPSDYGNLHGAYTDDVVEHVTAYLINMFWFGKRMIPGWASYDDTASYDTASYDTASYDTASYDTASYGFLRAALRPWAAPQTVDLGNGSVGQAPSEDMCLNHFDNRSLLDVVAKHFEYKRQKMSADRRFVYEVTMRTRPLTVRDMDMTQPDMPSDIRTRSEIEAYTESLIGDFNRVGCKRLIAGSGFYMGGYGVGASVLDTCTDAVSTSCCKYRAASTDGEPDRSESACINTQISTYGDPSKDDSTPTSNANRGMGYPGESLGVMQGLLADERWDSIKFSFMNTRTLYCCRDTCPTFPTAFGAALGYLAYIEMLVTVVVLVIYYRVVDGKLSTTAALKAGLAGMSSSADAKQDMQLEQLEASKKALRACTAKPLIV